MHFYSILCRIIQFAFFAPPLPAKACFHESATLSCFRTHLSGVRPVERGWTQDSLAKMATHAEIEPGAIWMAGINTPLPFKNATGFLLCCVFLLLGYYHSVVHIIRMCILIFQFIFQFIYSQFFGVVLEPQPVATPSRDKVSVFLPKKGKQAPPPILPNPGKNGVVGIWHLK